MILLYLCCCFLFPKMGSDKFELATAGKPERIVGLIKLNKNLYARVVWTNGRHCYLRYKLIKINFPELLVDFFEERGQLKRINS